jgi:hypothetical protein
MPYGEIFNPQIQTYFSMQPLLAELKKQYYTHYLYVVLAPEAARAPLLAFLAFDSELAQIPIKVSEEMLGHIRFAWWHETLEMLEQRNCARAHPVIDALKLELNNNMLSVNLLKKRLENHEQHFMHQHEISGNCSHGNESLTHDCVEIIKQHAPQAVEVWFRKACLIQAAKPPVSPKNIMLLLRLMWG